MAKTIIGIDIAKQKFDVAYKSPDQRWRQSKFPNTSQGFQDLLNGWSLISSKTFTQ